MRFFFEGSLQLPGQLWYADRFVMYHTVRQLQPEHVFEVGTWNGGGSTLFIAQALHDNGRGVVHTVEADPTLYQTAVAAYGRYFPHLLPHVDFQQGFSTERLPALLKQIRRVNCVFLDGLGAESTLGDFRMFEPQMGEGSVLMAHDWFDEKMALLRPQLERSPDWLVEQVITPPESVGFAVLRRYGH